MKLCVRQYSSMLAENNIEVIYRGPLWAGAVDGIAEMLQRRLKFDEIPLSVSQAVFSIFVEQINNMMMYSAEKEKMINSEGKQLEAPKGIFILGVKDKTYFIQCGNVVTDDSAAILKERINFLNTLDKNALHRYHKEQMVAANANPKSKGAGIGLIEIARRASSPIEYELEPCGEGKQYFTIFTTVSQGGKEE